MPVFKGNGNTQTFSAYHDPNNEMKEILQTVYAALKEKGKFVECNEGVLCSPKTTELFRHQYAEFMRELFEMGIPVTSGSDSHSVYAPDLADTEKYLRDAGFREGDFATLTEKDLW